MADLDNLKAVNDSYGHRTGDRVLAEVADVIRDGVRRIDTPSRLGGDEFVVLLPETDPTGAFVVAEKIRQGVAAMRTVERDRPVPLSVSVGLVAWPGDGATLDQLMNAVDERMYTSKRRGKNRIIGAAGPAVASLASERLVPISIGERPRASASRVVRRASPPRQGAAWEASTLPALGRPVRRPSPV